MEKKIILVTGGTGNIGSGIIRGITSDEYFIYFTYHENHAKAAELAESLGSEYVKGLKCDITNFEEVQNIIAQIDKEQDGRIDILINTFGITADNIIVMMDPADWNNVININLTGMFNVTKPVALMMMKQGLGSIINMSSVSGVIGLAGQVNYSASKAGIIGFSKALAKEVSPRGVRVNVIAPGFIEGAMTNKLSEKYLNDMIKNTLLRRIGKVEDLIGIVKFLMGEESSFITNQVFVVDGGLTA